MPASVRDVLLLIRTKEDAQRALAGISREMRRAQAAADAANARARAQELRRQAEQMRSVGATRQQIDTVLRSARAYDQQAKSIEQARRRSEMLHRAVSHGAEALTAAGVAGIAAGAGILYGLKQAVDIAAEYDRQTRLTFTQVDRRFKPSLIELGQIGRRVAREIAIPFEQVQPALFEVFSSTEANVKQAEFLLKAFAKAAVAGQTDVQTASRATIGLMNTFGIPFSKVNRLLDIQFQLVQEGVGTYEEWATRIGLVSPSAARAGQSIEMMAAALATATRMGMSAARAGTSVARAFDALSNPKTVASLEKLGVKVRDAKGNMLPMIDILKQWKAVLDKMPAKDRLQSILETMKGAGSTIEARRFLQNMLMTKDGLKLFQDILGEFTGDVGAFDKAYGEMADGVSSKSVLVRNQWQLLKEAIGRALLPAFSDLLTRMQKLLDWFNELPKGTQETIAKLLLLAGVIGIVGGTMAVVLGGFAMFAIALAGITSTGWAVIGIIAAVVAVFLALGVAAKAAYEKSKPLRDVFTSLKETGQEAWNILAGFASGVKQKFDQNLLPALRNLWKTVNDEILPKLRELIDWAKQEMLPKLKEAANVVKDWLGVAFSYVGWVINTIIIPGLKDLSKTWKENKDNILPYLQMLGQVAKVLLIVAGVILGVVVIALGTLLIAWRVGMFELKLFIQALAWLNNAWDWVTSKLGKVLDWMRKLDDKLRGTGVTVNAMGATVVAAIQSSFGALPTIMGNAAKKAVNALLGPFRGLPGMLNSLGRNAVGAFTSGLLGGRGAAAGAGASIASAAYNAAKSALDIKSPSKKFRDIGYNVVMGFVKGITGSRTQLINAMNRLTHDVMDSLRDGGASKKLQASWQKRLSSTSKTLLALEAKRTSITTRITNEQKKLADLVKARADLVAEISGKLAESANLNTLEGNSVADLKANLQSRLDALRAFQSNLKILANKGLNQQSIIDFAQSGVDQAGGIVGMLASGASNADIQQINQMQDSIRKIAGSTADTLAGQMYDAGIQASQGLIKGLQSQQAAITKQMTAIANALVKAIKKALGIKSPSRVFMGLGSNTALGYLLGYGKEMRKAKNLHAEMLAITQQPPRSPVASWNNKGVAFSPPNGGGSVQRPPINLTVNTHEIDPRRTAAELGWELQGRIS